MDKILSGATFSAFAEPCPNTVDVSVKYKLLICIYSLWLAWQCIIGQSSRPPESRTKFRISHRCFNLNADLTQFVHGRHSMPINATQPVASLSPPPPPPSSYHNTVPCAYLLNTGNCGHCRSICRIPELARTKLYNVVGGLVIRK